MPGPDAPGPSSTAPAPGPSSTAPGHGPSSTAPGHGPGGAARGARIPEVEISIVNHQNRELVRACLLSLPAACEGITWHATVVDNASGDGSLDMLARQFPDVVVIANRDRMGFGANHNQVLRPLIADPTNAPPYVLILNDDTTLRSEAVSRMARMLDADPTLGAVVPTILDTGGRAGASRIAYPNARSAWRCDWTDRTEPPDPVGGFLQGCCLLVRVAAIAQVGPFDERFFLFYEDTDLSRRLSDAGWSLGLCGEAVIEHVGHASVFGPELAATTPRQGRRSRYLYFCKHDGRARAELITGVGRLLLLVRAAKATAGAVLTHRGPRPLLDRRSRQDRRNQLGQRDQQDQRDRRERARRLFELARFNPRRPVAPDPRAKAGGAKAGGAKARRQKRK